MECLGGNKAKYTAINLTPACRLARDKYIYKWNDSINFTFQHT